MTKVVELEKSNSILSRYSMSDSTLGQEVEVDWILTSPTGESHKIPARVVEEGGRIYLAVIEEKITEEQKVLIQRWRDSEV